LWWLRQNDDFSGGCAQNDNLWWLRQKDEQKQTKANAGILRCAQNDNTWGCARKTTSVAAALRMTTCGGCARMTARVVVAGKRLIRCGLFG
jgi:hypothetical protein